MALRAKITGRVGIAFMAVLALLLTLVGGMPQAKAATIVPTVTTNQITTLDDQPLTGPVIDGQQFKFTFEFQAPAGTLPGDEFLVALPPEVTATFDTQDLDGLATATKVDGGIRVVFTEAIRNMTDVRGGFSFILDTIPTLSSGEEKTVAITIGTVTQLVPLVGAGPDPDMILNKWSGWSTDDVNLRKELKLQGWKYNFAWFKPVDDQRFAHWFIRINQNNVLDDIGNDVIVTDQMQPIPGFVPGVEYSADPAPTGLNPATILNGPYLNTHFQITIFDDLPDSERAADTFGNVDDPITASEFFQWTGSADSGVGFKFNVTDYLDSKGIKYAKNAYITIDYFTLVPNQPARVTNNASVESTNIIVPVSDSGWYQIAEGDGWAFATQRTTSVEVTKTWEGLAEGEIAPPVTFELLADGQPATGLDGVVVADQVETLDPGTTSYTWSGLPSQSAKDVPITYTVKETPVDGFTSTGTEATYVPNIAAPAAEALTGTIAVTNTKVPEPTVTPTEEPTVDPTVDPTPLEEPTIDPTVDPTPTEEPTVDPTSTETPTAMEEPTVDPTDEPTVDPTPTETPTAMEEPTESVEPTTPGEEPTPSTSPTQDPIPGSTPTEVPVSEPTTPAGPALPETGADTSGPIALAALMLIAGGAMLAVRRKVA